MRVQKPVLLFLLALFLPSQQARSQNPFGTSFYPVEYEVSYSASSSADEDESSDADFIAQNPAEATFNSSRSANSSASAAGDSASSSLDYSAIVAFATNIGVLTGAFDASAVANAWDGLPNEDEPIGEFSVRFHIAFRVESGSATVGLFGTGTASASGGDSIGHSELEILGPVPGGDFRHSIEVEAGSQTSPVTETITIGPGFYTLRFRISGEAYFNENTGGGASSSAGLDVNFTVSGSQVDQVFWAANDGGYDTAENWEPQTVPGDSQTAVFDRDADYTVTIGTETTGRAIVERGGVAFDGGTYALSQGTEDTGSIVVGGTAADFANLDLRLDDFSTVHAIVGEKPNSNGVLRSDESCAWINQGRLSIGKAGIGSVTIENGATLLTPELRIGDTVAGLGALTVKNTNLLNPDANKSLDAESLAIGLAGLGILRVESSAIETGVAEIGSLAGSVGAATLSGPPATFVGWVSDNLVVGKAGKGFLTFLDGNAMRVEGDIAMGTEVSAEAEVRIIGRSASDAPSALVTFNGTMTVGGKAHTELHIEGGAICGASEVIIGTDPVGDLGGAIFVRGKSASGAPSMLTVFEGPIRIGRMGTTPDQFTGILSLEEGGEVFCRNASVGHRGGSGRVAVDPDSKWTLSGSLFTSSADAAVDPPVPLTRALLFNHGRIEARSITMEIGTELYGEGVYSASEFIDYAGVLYPETEETGSKGPTEFAVMTFDGDFNMERGEFILDVGGTDEIMTDRVAILGDADITGGTITFNFVDGFLPQTGQKIPFLDISGNTVFENVQVVYIGAADGFEYVLVEQDGMVMLEALNDAEPLPPPNADLNGDGEIDSLDLFIFLGEWRK